MIKYAIIPDYVVSENDGEIHFISAMQLINLYGVPRGEYYIFDEDCETSLIKLKPRFKGDYKEHFERIKAGENQ